MIAISRMTTALALAAALMVPTLARAADEPDGGDVSVAADVAPAVETQSMPMGRGMGMQGMGCKSRSMGAGGCRMGKSGGMGKKSCRSMDGGDGEARIRALEKRVDALQMTLELLTRQQLDGDK